MTMIDGDAYVLDAQAQWLEHYGAIFVHPETADDALVEVPELTDAEVAERMAALRAGWAAGHECTVFAQDEIDNGGGWTNCIVCWAPIHCEAPEKPTCTSITPEGRCIRPRGHLGGYHEGRTGMLYR